MILGVLSDTHGNWPLMHRVAEAMTEQFGVETILHLGDDYADAEQLRAAGYSVRAVPGLWCREYHDSRIPKRLVEEFAGLTVGYAHAEKDLRYIERAAALVLTGHTHEAAIALLGRSLYVNPGHLKAPKNRGARASFATIEIGEETVRVRIHEANGVLREEVAIDRAQLGG
jgi:putative phosphoesterase